MRYFSSVFSFFNKQPYQLEPLTQKLRYFKFANSAVSPCSPGVSIIFFRHKNFKKGWYKPWVLLIISTHILALLFHEILVKITVSLWIGTVINNLAPWPVVVGSQIRSHAPHHGTRIGSVANSRNHSNQITCWIFSAFANGREPVLPLWPRAKNFDSGLSSRRWFVIREAKGCRHCNLGAWSVLPIGGSSLTNFRRNLSPWNIRTGAEVDNCILGLWIQLVEHPGPQYNDDISLLICRESFRTSRRILEVINLVSVSFIQVGLIA